MLTLNTSSLPNCLLYLMSTTSSVEHFCRATALRGQERPATAKTENELTGAYHRNRRPQSFAYSSNFSEHIYAVTTAALYYVTKNLSWEVTETPEKRHAARQCSSVYQQTNSCGA